MIATELKTGTVFKEDNAPFLVLKYEHIKSARSGAAVKVKARNLATGQVLLKNYLGSDKVFEADVSRKTVQYLYKDGGFIFMDPTSYDQFTISEDLVGDSADFLQEGENVQMLSFEDSPISIDLPKTVTFEISYTEPGFKGNTVSSAPKDATLSNGTVIKVPPFIKIGDKIKINTETRSYVSKA